MIKPRYPIYIPSRGRYDRCSTAKFFDKDGTDYHLVVEEQEYEKYAEQFGEDKILVLPDSNRGLVFARNWIKQHSIENGYARHWQFDDNIGYTGRRYKGRHITCNSRIACAIVENFVDRYENVAIAGMNYETFVVNGVYYTPFFLNVHVYSASLIMNSIPHQWRGIYNDDTDLCLQILSAGYCTVLFNAFFVDKKRTMTIKGGNTSIYQNDGRLTMARELQKRWPGVVKVIRRFGRPQHYVDWKKFDNKLVLKQGVNLENLQKANEYGLKLKQISQVENDEFYNVICDRLENDK